VFRLRPSAERFPVIVSQDCDHQETANVIKSYGDKLTLIRQPDQSEIKPPPKLKKFVGYYKIARHYGWALNQTFNEYKYKYAILTEGASRLLVALCDIF
jgi:alpha-1,3-mannosyl-glycoprotein beta-1,2-N-acetylglucosaminyltransferase